MRFTGALKEADKKDELLKQHEEYTQKSNILASKHWDEVKSLNQKISQLQDTLEDQTDVIGELKQTIVIYEVEKDQLRNKLEECGHNVDEL